jgi:hypothetical protein
MQTPDEEKKKKIKEKKKTNVCQPWTLWHSHVSVADAGRSMATVVCGV